MTLDNLIDALTAVDSTLIVPDGFTNPHSYRGYYDEVAFEPAHDVTAGAMLADALAARGATYTGWKGGEYTMTGDTPCWLAHEGSAGGEALDEDRVRRMLALARPADAAAVRAPAARPAYSRWLVEARDPDADEWAPVFTFDSADEAHAQRAFLDTHHPRWRDGRPKERRVVRETTTWTVEETR
ncbi:hypothetical protein [Streptomyces fradiae]|uniref:hypothetical protein n=1 Tax=Streptomyces fradiae TaxID=1906 RepID=UPI0036FFA794